MKKHLSILLVCVLALGMVVGGCGSPASSTPPAAKPAEGAKPAAPAAAKTDIVIALQGEPTSLDTHYPDDGNMRCVTWNVMEPLYKLNGKTLAPEACLATAYKNIDELTWEFKIRQGVKFHGGQDFTAEDAAYSVNRIIDPAYGSQILSDFDTIKKAEVVDKETIRIITIKPDPILLKRLAKLDMVSKSFTESKKAEELTLLCNGTGPYIFEKWTRGADITVKANDAYWGEKPVIKNAKFRFIEEPITRLSALKTGEINIAVNMYPEYAAELPKVFSDVGTETYWIRFDQFNGQMKSKQMRQAACYAIDLQGLADSLFLGYAAPCQGQMGRPGYFGFSDKVKMYPYDVEKAKSLLKEAGYKNEPIELLSERGRWLKDGELTEAVAAQLTEAGFNIQTKFVSWNEWLDTLFDRSKTPDLQFSSTSNEFFDMDRTYSAIVHGTGTQSGVDNPEYNKKIEAARSEMDPVKRQAIYDELVVKLYDDPFAIYLLFLNDLHGGSANLNWTLRQDSRVFLNEMSFS